VDQRSNPENFGRAEVMGGRGDAAAERDGDAAGEGKRRRLNALTNQLAELNRRERLEAFDLYPKWKEVIRKRERDISTVLNNEVSHYRVVAKKYKRAKMFVNWSAAGSSVLSAAFSSASLGSAVCSLPTCYNSIRRRKRMFRSRFVRAYNCQQKT